MTVVSSKEFVSNEDKYFDLAMNEQLFIQKGDYTFIVARTADKKRVQEKTRLKPDDDFRRAISMDEFKARAREVVTQAYNRYTDERNNSTRSTTVS